MRVFVILLCIIFFTASQKASAACPSISMSGQDVSCNGASDGLASVSVSPGGSGNYTYTWSNGTTNSGPSGSTIQFLSVGTYTVSVRDNVSGCTVTGAFVVGSPSALTLTGTVFAIGCKGQSTGGVEIQVNGGKQPYGFTWRNEDNNIVSNSQNLQNVVAGTYTVTVNAPNSACSISRSFTITEPVNSLSASGISQNIDCFGGNNGSITLAVLGGTPPYSYLWSNGAISKDLNTLTVGNYNVVVTDANGCNQNLGFNIIQPNPLTVSVTTSNILCHGENSGEISATVSGGVQPYDYAWSNSSIVIPQNVSTLSNLPADNYQLVVTDQNDCSFSLSEVISEPSKMTGSLTAENILCFGQTNGALNLTNSGGVPPYDFEWTNNAGDQIASSSSLSNVGAGVYKLNIKDQNNCLLALTGNISQPDLPISVQVDRKNVLCTGGTTGEIELIVTGGSVPYSYNWQTGETSNVLTNLTAGTYNYLITDQSGCSFGGNVTITEPSSPVNVIATKQDVLCFGESTGSVNLSVSGGTPGYNFSWSNSEFLLSVTSNNLTGFPSDEYMYEVTDANGCKQNGQISIDSPEILTVSLEKSDVLCFGQSNGTISSSVSGGTGTYSYLWNTNDVSSSLQDIPAGNYNLTVSDGNGCNVQASTVINQPDSEMQFSSIERNVTCNDGTNGEITILVTGGTPNYTYQWSNGGSNPTIQNLTAGVYVANVTDNNGCFLNETFTLTEPEPIVLNEDVLSISCKGLSDGEIIINPTGGTSPYSYSWFNSLFALATQEKDLIGFPAEIYQLEVSDSNGCLSNHFIELTEPDSLLLDYSVTDVSCAGGTLGSILLDVNGGTEPYNFDWSNGASTQDLENLPFGFYNVTVTDSNGCVASIEASLIEPQPIELSFETQLVSCSDQTDGIAWVTASGGNGGFTYLWSNGAITSENNNLSEGTYTVTATDFLGCNTSGSVEVGKEPIGCIDPVNAFTPNGDNYNDTWVIDNTDLYPSLELQVFNKWGNKIYESIGEYEPWDGTFNDEPLPASVYYWIIKLNNDNQDILKGTISIIR